MKRFMTLVSLLAVLALLAAGCGGGTSGQQEADQSQPQSKHLECVFKDPAFSFQLLRIMGESVYGCSDLGECLTAAYNIKEGDLESWYSQWYQTAERVRGFAEESLDGGHTVSAREAFLRAMNYYRCAEFFLHGDPSDPRLLETWGKSRDCFAQAARLSQPPIERVEIPYENTTLPGYFYKVDDTDTPRPTLILQTGFDGTLEELYCGGAVAAVRRGYNCLAFAGPGQGGVIREQGIPFRPDWEKVVTPVVDYLLTRPDVDPGRIALMGLSFGGYLAPRAAAFEHRLAALIADGGVYDTYAAWAENLTADPELPDNPDDMLQFIQENTDQFNGIIQEAMDHSTVVRWLFDNGTYTFGVQTPAELMLKIRDYTMEGPADRIKCPTLIVDSENDEDFPGQSKELYDHLTCPKEYILFTAEEGAGEHCQMGALLLSHQRIFDWLDQVFAQVE